MKNKKSYLVYFLIILVFIYIACIICLGKKDTTVVNAPIYDIVKNQPRLQDDYYDYINFKYLNVNQLEDDEVMWWYMISDSSDLIEEEKKEIIDGILKNAEIHESGSVYDKICDFYHSYQKNSDENIMKKELDYYIKMIQDTQNIEDYLQTIFKINKELSVGLIINPHIYFRPQDLNQSYFTLNEITYDFDICESEYYSLEDYEQDLNKLKKYNIEILKQYGYKENEAYKMANEVQEMYEVIARFSIKSDKLEDKGYKLYSFEQLDDELKVLDLTSITQQYDEIYNKGKEILVTDINQLRAIDSYLKEENLTVLKNYAILKILTEYSQYINIDFYKIRNRYEEEFGNAEKFDSEEKFIYDQIYFFFQDTITNEFAKKNFTIQEKIFYTDLVLEEIQTLKNRVLTKEWLSMETKSIAADKVEKIEYTVGVPEKFVFVENNYQITDENSYLKNIININKEINKEYNQQYKNGNILYGETDYLDINAFYSPYTNSIDILLGYIYAYKQMLDLDVNNLESSYYQILATIGATIGHELTHAVDSDGCKYDVNGNYINWWKEEDLKKFNELNINVVKHYNKYNQFGDTTLGENIADLGALAIVMDVANKHNATSEEYKTIFETYALDYCSQIMPYYKAYQLHYDEHSPNKNRVNAVLSTIDEFYEVYNILETDEMYLPKEERVKVW